MAKNIRFDLLNKAEAMHYVKNNGTSLRHFSDEVRNDREVCFEVIRRFADSEFRFASYKVRDDDNEAIKAIKTNSNNFYYVSERLQNNKDIILFALQSDPSNIYHCPKEILEDPNLVSSFCTRYVYSTLIPPELKTSKVYVMQLVKSRGKLLKLVSDEFKDDADVVNAAIARNGCTLKYASDRLRNNVGIVRAAVTQNACALKYASIELRNDWDITSFACTLSPNALYYVSPSLRNNREFIKTIIKKNAHILLFSGLPEKYLFDKEFVCEAIRESQIYDCGQILLSIPCKLQNDPNVVITAVLKFGYAAFQYLNGSMLMTPEVFQNIAHIDMPGHTITFSFYNKFKKCQVLARLVPNMVLNLLLVLI